MKRKIGIIFFSLGGLLLAASLCLVIYNLYESYASDKAAQEAVEILVEKIEENRIKEERFGEPVYKNYPEIDMPTVEIDGYKYVGYLEIPSIHLFLPVMQVCDYERLKISPCRTQGSVYNNNMIIAGHNYYRHFTPIKELPMGAKINFIDAIGNKFYYELTSSEILKPDQVNRLIEKTEEVPWDLSLYTCTTGGQTRFIARCEEIKQDTE